jgi:hypothetical protein
MTVHVEVLGGPGQPQGDPIYNKYRTTANNSQFFSVGDPDPDVFGHPRSFPFLINVLSGLK